jgi:hypothetical protein
MTSDKTWKNVNLTAPKLASLPLYSTELAESAESDDYVEFVRDMASTLYASDVRALRRARRALMACHAEIYEAHSDAATKEVRDVLHYSNLDQPGVAGMAQQIADMLSDLDAAGAMASTLADWS